MPKLVYLLPLSALLIAALSLFFSHHDEIIFARIIGGPTDSSEGFRGRIQLLTEAAGVLESQPDSQLELVVKQGHREVRRRLQTGPDGWVEFFVPRFPDEKLQLEVRAARVRQLAAGTIELSTRAYLDTAKQRQHAPGRHVLNTASVCLTVPGIVLAVPFISPITVSLRQGASGSACEAPQAAGVSGAEIQVKLRGAELLSQERCLSNEQGDCEFVVRPLHHNAEIAIQVRAGEQNVSFEQILPVVPGALSLDEATDQFGNDERRFLIRSPVPRDYVWYTIVSKRGRGPGGLVPLSAAEDGISSGHVSLSRKDLRNSFLVLASDADGRSTSSVGYPVSGQDHTLDLWDLELLDGAQGARTRSQVRSTRVRLALGVYALATILVTIFLFYRGVRGEQLNIEDKLRAAGIEDQGRTRGSLPLVVAVLCLFFAFSLTLVWIVAR